MSRTTFEEDLHVQGALSAAQFNPPSGCIDNDAIEAAAGIDATKVNHQHLLTYTQAPGSAVVAATHLLHIAHGDGTVVSLEAFVATLATDVSRTITIDLQKSTGGGAFATVLSSTLVLNTSNTIRVPVAATIGSAAYSDGDLFQLTVAVAGGSGSQAEGLCVTVTLREEP